MADVKISAAADAGTLLATDMLPLARSGSTSAYHATVAEIATFTNGAYVPNYATANPSMDGAAAPGTASTVSRGDHVHPADTSRAPLNSPTFTGTPVLPGATVGFTQATSDSSTKLATTAYVQTAMVAAGAGVSSFNGRAGTVVLSTADVVAVSPYSANAGRNLLHNALFAVVQRGTGPWSVNGGYLADRWKMWFTAPDTSTVQLSVMSDSDRTAIGDEAATNSLNCQFTGSGVATSSVILEQNIEGVRRLSGKTATISFWANANTSLKLGLSISQYFGTGGSPSAGVLGTGQSVTLSTGWARYSLIFTIPSVTGKTLGTNSNDMTQLDFWLSAGSNNATRAGNIGVQSGTINLWGIQLEIGSQATPLEKLDRRIDLANCQRFYQTGSVYINAYNTAGAQFGLSQPFPVVMRGTPTVALSGFGYANASGASVLAPTAFNFVFNATATAAATAIASANWTASADL